MEQHNRFKFRTQKLSVIKNKRLTNQNVNYKVLKNNCKEDNINANNVCTEHTLRALLFPE